jgi:hypothetical protein
MYKKIIIGSLLAILALCLSLGSVALADTTFAPNTNSTIYSQVLDSLGNPVDNATVYLTFRDWNNNILWGNETMSYVSGSSGLYSYSFTAPSEEGDYVAEAYAEGYGYNSEIIHIAGPSVNITNSLGSMTFPLELAFAVTLCGFAFWRRSWVRMLLSLCIIAWGIFMMSQDVKIAAALFVVGIMQFIAGVRDIREQA